MGKFRLQSLWLILFTNEMCPERAERNEGQPQNYYGKAVVANECVGIALNECKELIAIFTASITTATKRKEQDARK